MSLLTITLLLTLCFLSAHSDVETSTCHDASTCGAVEEDVEFLSDEKPIVVLDYQDLVNKADLRSSIGTAYGASGLGILLVKNIPDLESKRERLLKLSRTFAVTLPSKYRENLVNEESYYSVGWSHGKEKLAKDQPDLRKGSFYGNPIYDDPTNGNEDLIKSHPAFYYPNVWPHSENNNNNDENGNGNGNGNEKDYVIPEIGMTIDEFGREMRDAFMGLGSLIVSTGFMLSDTMDSYVTNVRSHTNYEKKTLSQAIQTRHPKARLLYYFSENEYQEIMNQDGDNTHDQTSEKKQNNEEIGQETENSANETDTETAEREDSWCGWHNDHSALTGLALGMYFDGNGNVIETLSNSVAGLYVKNRMGDRLHLHFDAEDAEKYLAFQIGETSQILSGGALYATPHSVRGPIENEYVAVGRSTMAVFMQPSHDHHMRAPSNVNITMVQFDRNLPPSVPTLKSRWTNETGDTFGKFSQRTFETYY